MTELPVAATSYHYSVASSAEKEVHQRTILVVKSSALVESLTTGFVVSLGFPVLIVRYYDRAASRYPEIHINTQQRKLDARKSIVIV